MKQERVFAYEAAKKVSDEILSSFSGGTAQKSFTSSSTSCMSPGTGRQVSGDDTSAGFDIP